MEQTLKFTFERETKRTYRFQEEGDAPLIGTLYVQKTAFRARPERVEVTVRAQD